VYQRVRRSDRWTLRGGLLQRFGSMCRGRSGNSVRCTGRRLRRLQRELGWSCVRVRQLRLLDERRLRNRLALQRDHESLRSVRTGDVSDRLLRQLGCVSARQWNERVRRRRAGLLELRIGSGLRRGCVRVQRDLVRRVLQRQQLHPDERSVERNMRCARRGVRRVQRSHPHVYRWRVHERVRIAGRRNVHGRLLHGLGRVRSGDECECVRCARRDMRRLHEQHDGSRMHDGRRMRLQCEQ
jgi:hypothetical protein